jgi:hypothetical protein
MFGLSLGASLSIFLFVLVAGMIFIYSKLSDIDKRLYYILKMMESKRERELDDD